MRQTIAATDTVIIVQIPQRATRRLVALFMSTIPLLAGATSVLIGCGSSNLDLRAEFNNPVCWQSEIVGGIARIFCHRRV